MFKSNKGISTLIIIIIIVVVVLIVLSVGGYMAWKYLQEPERESRDREKDRESDEVQDCGVSRSFLSDFDDLIDIDFEKDDAMVCMGENIQDNCKDSTAIVKIEDGEFSYKISGKSESKCRIEVEYYNPDEKTTSYVECPILGLVSFIEEEDPDVGDKLSVSSGHYAGILLVAALIISDDEEAATDIGCVVDVPGRDKANDAGVKSDLAQLRTMAELHYIDNNDSYIGFSVPGGMVPPECSSNAYTVQIASDGRAYLVYAKLCSKDAFWCADSTGFFGEVYTISNNAYLCQ